MTCRSGGRASSGLIQLPLAGWESDGTCAGWKSSSLCIHLISNGEIFFFKGIWASLSNQFNWELGSKMGEKKSDLEQIYE